MQISRQEMLRAYRQMAMIRAFEERLHIENRTGEIAGFIHLYAGQEAIAVGVCENLTDRDYIISTHRGHGHSIAKGCDVTAMMLEIYGSRDGMCKGRSGSMHIADVDKGMLGANAIVGGGPPIAVGAAIASKVKKDGSVAVSFSGDGASNQGTVFEAMNMAVVLKVPKVFVFENNGYSEHTGASYGVGTEDPVKRIAGFGLPVWEADGTDFFSVHEAARQAIGHARDGNGPSAIYAEAMRYFGHFEGDPQFYRAKGEVEALREGNDCLLNFRRRTIEGALLEAAELDGIDRETADTVDEAVATARAAPRPTPEAVLEDVYATY